MLETLIFLVLVFLLYQISTVKNKLSLLQSSVDRLASRAQQSQAPEHTAKPVDAQVETFHAQTAAENFRHLSEDMPHGDLSHPNATHASAAGSQTSSDHSKKQHELEQAFVSASGPASSVMAPVHHDSEIGTEASSEHALVAWLQRDWLLKIGALLLILAFAWLVTYSFSQGWIGPIGVISICLVIGVGVMSFGFAQIKKYATQGAVFMVLGACITLITLYAAWFNHHIFNTLSVTLLMFATCVVVSWAAVQARRYSMVLLSIIIANCVPVLVSSANADHNQLFLYLLLVMCGTIWVVVLTGWRSLFVYALGFYGLYSLAEIAGGHNPDLLIYGFLFAGIFYAINLVEAWKQSHTSQILDVYISTVNALLLLVWIMHFADESWKTVIILIWMLVFMLGSFVVQKLNPKSGVFFSSIASFLLYLATATAHEFHGEVQTIAYTAEVTGLVVAAYFATKRPEIARRTLFGFIVPVLLSFDALDRYHYPAGVFSAPFWVLAALVVALLFAGGFVVKKMQKNQKTVQKTEIVTIAVGVLYLLGLIWMMCAVAYYGSSVAVTVPLIVYTLLGIASYFVGLDHKIKPIQYAGGALLVMVVLRLLLIDIWNMSTAYRIITFFAVGILFVSTAFLTRKEMTK